MWLNASYPCLVDIRHQAHYVVCTVEASGPSQAASTRRGCPLQSLHQQLPHNRAISCLLLSVTFLTWFLRDQESEEIDLCLSCELSREYLVIKIEWDLRTCNCDHDVFVPLGGVSWLSTWKADPLIKCVTMNVILRECLKQQSNVL